MPDEKSKPEVKVKVEAPGNPDVVVVAEVKTDGTTTQVFKGVATGAYEFLKDTFNGLVDTAKFAIQFARDPATREKAYQTVAGIGKALKTAAFGSDEERNALYKQMKDTTSAMKDALKKEFQDEYDKAKKEGREAEVIAKWSTKGGLEIASMFVGAGAVAKVAKGTKAAAALEKAGNVLGGATARCKAVMEQATKAAGTMAKVAKQKAIAKAGGAASSAAKLPVLRNVVGAVQMTKGAAKSAVAASGMLKAAARSVQKIAMKHQVRIKMRPGNKESLKWIEKGNPRKPEFLKNKTIKDIDVLIGPPPSKDDVGLVGNFNPKALDRAAIEKKAGKVFSKEEWEKLESHAASRRNEYAEMKHDLETKAKFAEKVAVDEARGVLVDARNGATKGKEFTGDHDLFSIEKPVGNGKYEVVTSESDPKLYKAVTDDLKADPHVQAQHGAHTSWEADKGAPLTPKEQKISDKIYDQHKADAKPSEALTTFDADGTVHETHYDGPKGSARTGGQ